MHPVEFFEDFEMGTSRVTHARTVTEADIVIHAGHSGDFMPHHTDAEFCKTQPFKKVIAHGTMTFAMAIGLSVSGQPLNPNGMSYGYNKLRYPKPVFAGDTIRVRITVHSKEDHPKKKGYGQVVEVKEVLNQHDEVVMYAEHVLFVKKRNA
ncbi:MaoC family dehydratase [Aestuariirhabdus litorea]|uniref:MaoC family dehydratase n=1 Tax=Aestuariirhabdus litorea TaxID=2528527 RepID=A0A3P3VI46_9GAMM|nr:MaoC family dehydratase [Aestuariirhabdus litorea]RRJ82400.1 MaoC family dehydratase [Aestuariirhabdus litorea]RWW92563.1 MaoC family dehydratase [Endozoicomonadaceae bacterium GTF-13]